MKIECDKCGAKYSIADDKVRGKTFKIRCKKCSNVIIVREKADGAAGADGGSEPEQGGGDEAGWHLAIDGETVGPLSEQEVRDRFAAGEIDRDTSVWQEGFEDWLPLGDVETFSDLSSASSSSSSSSAAVGAAAGAAAAAAAAAADPFAPSNDDFGGGAFSEPEPAPAPVARETAAPKKEASRSPSADHSAGGGHGGGGTPRVSALTGARNENSVLFSLDSLSAVALGGGAGPRGGGASPAAAPTPSGPTFSVAPAASAPASQTTATGEGSGLIDIRAMSAMLGGGGGGGAAAEAGGGSESGFAEAAIPSFGGGFGGLAAAPLSLESQNPEAVVAPEPVRASNGPLYALIGILALGLVGVMAFVMTREPPEPEKIVERVIVPGQVPSADDDDDEPKKKKKKKKEEEEEEEEEEGSEESAASDAADSAGTKSTKKTTSTKKGSTKTTATKDGGDTKATATKDGGETKPAPTKEKEAEDVSVDCLLDSSKCKKGGSSGGSGGGSTKPPADTSGLPQKLTAEDIKAGVASAKSSAESKCKGQAKGGEKVVVKISIEGSSGKVVSSTADGTPLGNCVAQELKSATFKKFAAPQQGAQISVRF